MFVSTQTPRLTAREFFCQVEEFIPKHRPSSLLLVLTGFVFYVFLNKAEMESVIRIPVYNLCNIRWQVALQQSEELSYSKFHSCYQNVHIKYEILNNF